MVKDFPVLKSLDVSSNNLGAENALTVGLKVPPEVETVVLCNTGIHLTDDELSDTVGSSLKSPVVGDKRALFLHNDSQDQGNENHISGSWHRQFSLNFPRVAVTWPSGVPTPNLSQAGAEVLSKFMKHNGNVTVDA